MYNLMKIKGASALLPSLDDYYISKQGMSLIFVKLLLFLSFYIMKIIGIQGSHE